MSSEAVGADEDHAGPESVVGEISSAIVTASNDWTASVWDIETGEAVVTVRHDLDLNCAVFDPSGMAFATASQDNSAKVWDATTGELLTEVTHRFRFTS